METAPRRERAVHPRAHRPARRGGASPTIAPRPSSWRGTAVAWSGIAGGSSATTPRARTSRTPRASKRWPACASGRRRSTRSCGCSRSHAIAASISSSRRAFRGARGQPAALELGDEAAPEATADAARVRHALDRCLAELDARSRRLVELRFRDELDYDEIAALTADSPGALRVRLTRARRALRGHLARHGVTW
jgi:RNA polymerase sigma factor (sigma-70 family)